MKHIRTYAVLALCSVLLFGVWGLKQHPQIREVLNKPLRELTYEERRDGARAKIIGYMDAVKGNRVRVDLGPIAGRNLGGLYRMYLGVPPGPMPKEVDVSFDERMASMYHQKVMFKKCKPKELDNCRVSSDTVLSQAPGILEAYLSSDKMKMNLSQFISVAEGRVRLAKVSIDWQALCRNAAYRLSDEKCKLLQSISNGISGRDLVAYGMTELLPSSDGDLNVRYMDTLLRYAGAQFVYYVPALGDGLASLGLYQFTFYALRKDQERVEGVNVVNAFVKQAGEHVPGSVVYLRGHQHHTAAYYFAVHNLASLISRLSDLETKTLKDVHRGAHADMVVIVACAHHNPGYTRAGVSSWLKALDAARHPPKGKKVKQKEISTDLVSKLTTGADLRAYGEKTRGNLKAVYRVK